MQEVVTNDVKHIHYFNYELIHLIVKTIVSLQVSTFMETYFQIVKFNGFLKIKGDGKSLQTATPTSTAEMLGFYFYINVKKQQKKTPQTS